MYTNTANDLVIQTNALSKSFGVVQALDRLDLAVPKHAIVGFLGPNGAGKSTTIKLLLGLARPTAGRGTVFGLDVVRDSTEIRKMGALIAVCVTLSIAKFAQIEF